MSESSLIAVYIIVFGLSVLIPSVLISYIVKYTRVQEQKVQKMSVILFFIVWFILANYFGYVSPVKLVSLLVLASIPLLISVLFIVLSPFFKNLLINIPSDRLIALQVYRILGFMFIYLYVKEHFLSKGFALFAGIGDMLIGLTALPVAWSLKNKIKGSKAIAVTWNLLGIADLIIAPLSAIIFGNKGINFYPLVLVPLFIGPPFSILLHVASLRNIFFLKAHS